MILRNLINNWHNDFENINTKLNDAFYLVKPKQNPGLAFRGGLGDGTRKACFQSGVI